MPPKQYLGSEVLAYVEQAHNTGFRSALEHVHHILTIYAKNQELDSTMKILTGYLEAELRHYSDHTPEALDELISPVRAEGKDGLREGLANVPLRCPLCSLYLSIASADPRFAHLDGGHWVFTTGSTVISPPDMPPPRRCVRCKQGWLVSPSGELLSGFQF